MGQVLQPALGAAWSRWPIVVQAAPETEGGWWARGWESQSRDLGFGPWELGGWSEACRYRVRCRLHSRDTPGAD